MTLSLAKQIDVFRLPLPTSGEAVYFDQGKPSERVAGLALRVREGGSRKFVFHYRWAGRSQRITIGDASAWSLDKARAKARELRVMIDDGVNPADARTAAKIEAAKLPTLLSSIVAAYLDDAQTKLRPRTQIETTRYLAHYLKPLHNLPIGAIERRDVAVCLQGIAKNKGTVTADRARSCLSAMFAWAIGEGLADENPVIGTNRRSDDDPRTRVLSDVELAKLWNGLPDTQYGGIVRLLILTGCRREEIGGLQRSEIDFDAKTITLPATRTKNHTKHIVPLSDLALGILESQKRILGRSFVFGWYANGFTDWMKSKARLDEVVPLQEPWVIHDIRRTVRTGLGKLGVAPHIAEAVLNHLPAKLIRTYDRHTYEPEKRAALDAWANHIRLILAQAEGANVVTIARA
jgi:integrase